MAELGLLVVLLGACGFVAGLRPSRRDRPDRLLAILALYSTPVGLAACVLISDKWMARLREWLDPKGLALMISFAIVAVVGSVVLTPAWGYAMGRTLSWARSREPRQRRSR